VQISLGPVIEVFPLEKKEKRIWVKKIERKEYRTRNGAAANEL